MNSSNASNSEAIVTIEDHVKKSELTKNMNPSVTFDYELREKAVKTKLVKAAKRIPIEMEENSTSTNLLFSPGAWYHVVLPSIKYWMESQEKTCKVGQYEIKVGGIKEGKEKSGKHVNTKVVFFADREKVVCHLYNTTQLILINGHGYRKFIELFLKPFLISKIDGCIEDIELFNNDVVKQLGPKTVKRTDVKFKKGSAFPCHSCDFAAKSIPGLKKHKKNEHGSSFNSSKVLIEPRQSTRNNSIVENLMIEDVTVTDLTNETNVEENTLKYTCNDCMFVTTSKTNIDDHVQMMHQPEKNEEVRFVCIICQHELTEAEDYENHIKLHERRENKDDNDMKELQNIILNIILEYHIEESKKESESNTEEADLNFECSQCDFQSEVEDIVKDHNKRAHQPPRPHVDRKVKCELCDYVCDLNIEMKEHIEKEHPENEPTYECDICGFSDDFIGNMWKHKLTNHASESNMQFNQSDENTSKDLLLNILAEQSANLMEQVASLQKGVKENFLQVTTEFEEIIKNMENTAEKRQKQMMKVISNLQNKLDEALSTSNAKKKDPKASLSQPAKQSSDIPPPPSSSSASSNNLDSGSRQKKTEYQRKQRLLLVGDSLAHNTNFNKLEVVTNTTIKSAKAYSSVFDNSARFKHQNVTDVAKKELAKAPFKHLVLAAPTVDISNLNTDNVRAKDNVDVYKEKVRKSCRNMMKVAQDALTSHPELMKVTIMNHAPRYDSSDVDPVGLKPILANFANSYFLELWLDSPLKNKIIIGSHSLECTGDEKVRRYTDERNGRCDGVHMYGRAGKAAYTDSVLNILISSIQPQNPAQQKHASQTSNDDHTSCPQTNYKSKQKKLYSSAVKGKSGVKTQNRFSPLGSWSENC